MLAASPRSMLLEHLYRVSLERPEFWAMYIGLPTNTVRLLETRIDLLGSYISGLRQSCRLAGVERTDLDDFLEWLRDVRAEFPYEGWATKYLDDCGGDHIQAIGKFWGLLYEYLLLEKPEWFIRLNTEPIPSEIKNFYGVPKDADLRKSEHIKATSDKN